MCAVFVAGSTNTDMVVRTTRFPMPGETLIGGEFFMFSGGKGANQAVAAARLGAKVYFIGKTGNDVFGERVLQQLAGENIDTRFLVTDPAAASGTALILVDAKGENEIVVAPGANDQLLPEDIEEALGLMDAGDILLVQLEIPLETVAYAVEKASAKGMRVILNPAPARALPDKLFPHLFLVTPNETEAGLLTGISVSDETTATQAAHVLISKGIPQVIITLGAKGALFVSGQEQMLIPAPRVQAIDSTAAGDVFNGALAASLSKGLDWKPAIELACKAATLSVTKMGAQSSMPYLSEL
ncbi:MAG: ribokinase [Bacteroidota bacterium]|nr:ribokinase [Bacteroidota bacterium]